jgi:hypothetical protein
LPKGAIRKKRRRHAEYDRVGKDLERVGELDQAQPLE